MVITRKSKDILITLYYIKEIKSYSYTFRIKQALRVTSNIMKKKYKAEINLIN